MSTTETRTTSGGAYYNTAVGLRQRADNMRAEAEKAAAPTSWPGVAGGAMQQFKIVGYELAAAIYCLAQSIEDHRG